MVTTPLTPILAWQGWRWFGIGEVSATKAETSPPQGWMTGLWALALAVFWGVVISQSTTWIGAGLVGLSVLAFVDGTYYWWQAKQQGKTPTWPTLTPLDGWIALWIASAVIATGWSSVQPDSVIGLVKLLLLVKGYAIGRWVWWRYPQLMTWQVVLWLGLGLFQAWQGWLQVTGQMALTGPLATWQDPNLHATQKLTRIVGTLRPLNPNLLAGFLIPVVGLAWASVGQGWLVISHFRTKLLTTIVAGLLAICLTWALVMTGSRGGYLSLVVMAGALYAALGHGVFYQLGGKPWWRWLWIGLALVVLGLVVWVVAGNEALLLRVTSMVTGDSSTSYRWMVYRAAFEMLRDNWLWGIGPGNLTFQQVYGYYQTPGFNALAAYSVPLEIWIEQGIVGLVSAAGILISMVLTGLQAMDAFGKLVANRWWVCGLWAALLGMVAYGIFDTVWYRPAVNITFWMLVAMLVTQHQQLFSEPDNING